MNKKPVAVIVGIGPGLSMALARRFAAGGYRVIGFGRDVTKSETAISQMRTELLTVDLRAVDAGDFEKFNLALAETEKEFGSIEVLIYNAYRMTPGRPSQLDPLEAVADFKVNVAAPLVAAQAVLPRMLKQKKGSIVFTGGGLAIDPTGWLEASSLAIGKSGVRSLALTLNKELAPEGVHVGTVTIAGAILPGTRFDPELIAEAYWEFIADKTMTRPAEFVYRG